MSNLSDSVDPEAKNIFEQLLSPLNYEVEYSLKKPISPNSGLVIEEKQINLYLNIWKEVMKTFNKKKLLIFRIIKNKKKYFSEFLESLLKTFGNHQAGKILSEKMGFIGNYEYRENTKEFFKLKKLGNEMIKISIKLITNFLEHETKSEHLLENFLYIIKKNEVNLVIIFANEINLDDHQRFTINFLQYIKQKLCKQNVWKSQYEEFIKIFSFTEYTKTDFMSKFTSFSNTVFHFPIISQKIPLSAYQSISEKHSHSILESLSKRSYGQMIGSEKNFNKKYLFIISCL